MKTLFFCGVTGGDDQWEKMMASAFTFRSHLPPGADVRLFAMHDEYVPDWASDMAKRITGGQILLDPTVTTFSRKFEAAVRSPSKWPPVIYSKFLLPRYSQIGSMYDRFVWFDNDMEAVRDADMLMSYPLPHGIGAVADAGAGTWDSSMMREDRVTKAGLARINSMRFRSEIRPDTPYYNAGIVAIEPARLPPDYAATLFRAAASVCDLGINLLPEQDLMNAAFDIDPLPPQLGSFDYLGQIDKDAIIRHYSGRAAKPAWSKRVKEILSQIG